MTVALPGARRALTPLLRPLPLGASAEITSTGIVGDPGLASGIPGAPGALVGAVKGESGVVNGAPPVPRALVTGLTLHPGAPAQRDTWRLASSASADGPADGNGGSSTGSSAVSGSEGAGAAAEGGSVAAPGPSDPHPTAEVKGAPARFEDASTGDSVTAHSAALLRETDGVPVSSVEGPSSGEPKALSGDERESMRQRMKMRGGYALPGDSSSEPPPVSDAATSASADVAGADVAMAQSPLTDQPPPVAAGHPLRGSATASDKEAQVQAAVDRAMQLLKANQQKRHEMQARRRQVHREERKGGLQGKQVGQGQRAGGEGKGEGREVPAGSSQGEESQSAGTDSAQGVTTGVPGLSTEEAVDRAVALLGKQQERSPGDGREVTAGVPGLSTEAAVLRAVALLEKGQEQRQTQPGRAQHPREQQALGRKEGGVFQKDGKQAGSLVKESGEEVDRQTGKRTGDAPVVLTAGVPGLSPEEAAKRALEVLAVSLEEHEESYVTRKVMSKDGAAAAGTADGAPRAGGDLRGPAGGAEAEAEKEVVVTPGVPGLSTEQAVARAMELLRVKLNVPEAEAEGGGGAQTEGAVGNERRSGVGDGGRTQRGAQRGEGRERREGGSELAQGQPAAGTAAPAAPAVLTAGVPGLSKEGAVQRALGVLANQVEKERSSRQGSISRFAEAAFARRTRVAPDGALPGPGAQGRGGDGAPGAPRRGALRQRGGGAGRGAGRQRDSGLGIGIRAAPRKRVSDGKVGGRVITAFEKEIAAAQWTPDEEAEVAEILAAADYMEDVEETLHRNFLVRLFSFLFVCQPLISVLSFAVIVCTRLPTGASWYASDSSLRLPTTDARSV